MHLIVIPWSTDFRGGVSVVVRQLADQWQREGVPNQIVVDDWHARTPSMQGREMHFSFAVADQPNRLTGALKSLLRAPGALRRILHFLNTQGCTGVNFHYPGLNALGVALLKGLHLYKGRLVLSFHGTDVRTPASTVERLLWRYVFARADAVTTCSSALKERLLGAMPAAADKVKVAYNGVDLGVFRPGEQPAAPRHIVSLGGYVPLKGHRFLIDAMASLVRRGHDLTLTIAGGSGPEHAPLLEQARESGIEGRVQLLRDLPQAEVAALLHRASLVVQPSLSEAFGLAVIESAASGVPVLVSDAGGHLEIVENGRTGWVFRSADAQACAEALEAALTAPAEAALRAERLRAEVGERFTWPRLAAQMRALLSP